MTARASPKASTRVGPPTLDEWVEKFLNTPRDAVAIKATLRSTAELVHNSGRSMGFTATMIGLLRAHLMFQSEMCDYFEQISRGAPGSQQLMRMNVAATSAMIAHESYIGAPTGRWDMSNETPNLVVRVAIEVLSKPCVDWLDQLYEEAVTYHRFVRPWLMARTAH